MKKFHIPFTVSDVEKLKRRSEFFKRKIRPKRNSGIGKALKNIGLPLTREQYLSICARSFIIFFIWTFVITTTFLGVLQVRFFYLLAIVGSFVVSWFVFFNQAYYPKAYAARKQKDIERNLIPALEDVSVQLNSGVPIFSILVNISSSDYGELSREFRKAVKRINAGYPQAEVLEELGEENSSLFFRRALWQISNGMKAGSDISIVVTNIIKSLNEEQIIQIQNYGNKLNPLIMFYMLVSVILPALAIAFMTVISSLVGLSQVMATFLFVGLFVFVMFIQVMFLGIIKSIRPSLL